MQSGAYRRLASANSQAVVLDGPDAKEARSNVPGANQGEAQALFQEHLGWNGSLPHQQQSAEVQHSSAGTDSDRLQKTQRFSADPSLGLRETVLMALLSLQSGAQPLLTSACVSKDIIITTQVMASEALKVAFAASALLLSGSFALEFKTLRPLNSLAVAAVPAAIYAVQNTLIQMAYRHVDSVTFSLLNQTKLISTALCNFLFLSCRKRQSAVQILALLLMLFAAVLLTTTSAAKSAPSAPLLSADALARGIAPLLAASLTSGLGSTYSQWIMQVHGRSPHVYTIEMCSLSFGLLLISTLTSADGRQMREMGALHAWTPWAVLPPLTQALGGILVGLVTKYAGGVQKGFCIIFGLIIAALLQFFVEAKDLSPSILLALPLVIGSTYLHSMNPYRHPKTRKD